MIPPHTQSQCGSAYSIHKTQCRSAYPIYLCGTANPQIAYSRYLCGTANPQVSLSPTHSRSGQRASRLNTWCELFVALQQHPGLEYIRASELEMDECVQLFHISTGRPETAYLGDMHQGNYLHNLAPWTRGIERVFWCHSHCTSRLKLFNQGYLSIDEIITSSCTRSKARDRNLKQSIVIRERNKRRARLTSSKTRLAGCGEL